MAEPARRQNLATLVDDWERHGSQCAIVSSEGVRQKRTSYSELASLTRRFGAELFRLNVAKGERVLLWAENSAEWIAAFFGCVLRGILPVPLDVTGTRDFATRIAAETSPRLVAVDRARFDEDAFSTPVVLLETLAEALPREEAEPFPNLTLDDPLQIIFTSGTTGDPKGVVHTHGNVLASLAPIEQEMQKYLRYERPFHPLRILHTLPLSHVFGQFMGLWIPALLAAEVHFQPRLVAADLVEQVHRERISVLAAVPRVLDLMQTYSLERFPHLAERTAVAQNLSAWRRWWRFRDLHKMFGWKFWAFVCGGAALSPAGEQFWNALGFVVIQGYGMTETTALVSLNHPFRPAQGSIGQVLPGREVRLSEEGEVLVRGDTISRTSWQNGGARTESSQWLNTGDLAEFDDAGNLRFRGRKKDVIVTAAGLNVHPEDLEAALSRQAGVKAASVIETNSGHGPEPMAALVLAPQTDAHTVVNAANQELAAFQQIRHWLLWPEPDLPRTATGKVLRREIARRVASGDLANLASQNSPAEALNLDSLGRVELQAKLEQQYGITLDDGALQDVRTTEDLERLVKAAPAVPQADGLRNQREAHSYPHWTWHPLQQAIRGAFLELIAMPFVRFLGSPRVHLAGPKPSANPLLLVANHITSYDAAFILYALPGHIRRRVAIAMSGEMLLDMRRGRNQGSWFLNLLAPIGYFLILALFNVFPLPQRGGFRRSFRHAGEAIDRGYSVLVFPEGRRSDDGTPQPFQAGAGLLWRDTRIAALPVFLAGLGDLKSQGGRWFRSGKIEVTVGNALPLDPDRSPEQLTEELREAVFALAQKR